MLRDDPAPIEQPWQPADLISPLTTVDCGPITVEFFNDDAGRTALDPVLFEDNRATSPNNVFKVLYSEDASKKGSHPLRYRVYHTNYPLNVAL